MARGQARSPALAFSQDASDKAEVNHWSHDHAGLTTTLEVSDSRLLTILDGLPIAVMLRSADGTLLHINPGGQRFLRHLGVDVSAIHSSPSSLMDHVRVIDEDGSPHEVAALPVVSAIREVSGRDATLGYGLPGGGFAWYRIRAAPVRLGDGTTGTLVTLDDVTERQAARHRVAVAERSLRLTFDNAPIGMAVVAPDGTLLQVNAALCDLLGHDEARLLADGLHGAVHAYEGDDEGQQFDAWLSGGHERFLGDRRFRHASGRWIHCQLSVALVRDDDGTPLHLIAQVVDLSERRALEQELRAAAVEDPLTGLANRRALDEQLTVSQRRRARDGGDIGLLYLDLDHFKAINDDYGHDIGDRVLVETGQRLLSVTREVDTVCRLGGDEFVILCAPIESARALREIVDRIASIPPLTMLVSGVSVTVGMSIGSVMVRPDEDLHEALRRADVAMYRAKRAERTYPQQTVIRH